MRSGNQTLQLEIHRKSLRNEGFNWEIIEVDGGCASNVWWWEGILTAAQSDVISHHEGPSPSRYGAKAQDLKAPSNKKQNNQNCYVLDKNKTQQQMGTSQRSSKIKQKLNHGMQWYFHMYSIVQYTIINTNGSGKKKKTWLLLFFIPILQTVKVVKHWVHPMFDVTNGCLSTTNTTPVGH